MSNQPNKSNGAKPAGRKINNLLVDRRVRLALSVLGAIVAWMVVTIIVQPGTTNTIYNVPVDYTYDSAAYTSRGLSIVSAGIGGGIIGIIHRHVINGDGGSGLDDNGDHHPRNDGTQHGQCQPDAAVIQKILFFADGRLCAVRLIRLVAHCCSSSPFWLIQFHSFFACSTQLSAVFFSTVDSLVIISSMSRVYRLWRSK